MLSLDPVLQTPGYMTVPISPPKKEKGLSSIKSQRHRSQTTFGTHCVLTAILQRIIFVILEKVRFLKEMQRGRLT